MPESKRLLLQLNPRLFDALHRWADDELRSVTGQVEYLLTDQARRAGRLAGRPNRRHPRETPGDDAGDPEPDSKPAGAATIVRLLESRDHRFGERERTE